MPFRRFCRGPMDAFVDVAAVSEIDPGTAKTVVVQGHAVALFNIEGTFYAMSNVCLHRGGPLADGIVDGGAVTCPLHGWEYDVRTGRNLANPAARLKTYAVRVDGGRILVSP